MLPKNALRILRAHEILLRERDIKYEKVGCGAYMFVAYSLEFDEATIHRYWTLDGLLENYMKQFMTACHLEVNYAYLKRAGLLTLEEKTFPITPFSNRFSMYRGDLDDVELALETYEEYSGEFLKVA